MKKYSTSKIVNTSSLYSHYAQTERPRRKLTIPQSLYGWSLLFFLFGLFFGLGHIASHYLSPIMFSDPYTISSK